MIDQAHDDFLAQLTGHFVFNNRPVPIPVDYRPSWRLAVLCLLLKNCCKGSQSSLERLTTLSWAVRTDEGQTALTAYLEGKVSAAWVSVRFEPGLGRTLDLAEGEGLVTRRLVKHGLRYELTESGLALAGAVTQDGGFVKERAFMNQIGKRVTEDAVKALMSWRPSVE